MKSTLNKFFFPHDDKPYQKQYLDGLRGLAVLFVAFAHLSNNKIHIIPFLDFGGIGQNGVNIFFVLSAYLLDNQIYKALLEKKNSISYWKYYFARRFLRIYPLYIVSLLIYLGLSHFHFPYRIGIGNWGIFWDHVFLQKTRGVYWSIPIEFKFYFLSPLLLLVCFYVLKNRLLLISSLILILIAISWHLESNGFDRASLSTLGYLQVFLFGTWLAIAERLHFRIRLNVNVAQVLAWALLASLIIFSTPHFFRMIPVIGQPVGLFFRHNLFVPAITIMMLMMLLRTFDGSFRRFFELRFLRFLGVIGYSFYLFHYPIVKFVKTLEFTVAEGFLKVLIFSVITLLVSITGYLLIERPFKDLQFRKSISEF